MSDYIYYINGEFMHAKEAKIPFEDGGFQRGNAVFETIRFKNNNLFYIDSHLQRLQKGLSYLEFKITYTHKELIALMKETINPIWEDEHNINGGCISFKLDKQNSYKIWENYIIHLVSNNLDEKVNGVSISPKRNFNIIKLWISEEIEVSNFNIPKTMLIPNDNILFRSHKINIEKDKKKQAK